MQTPFTVADSVELTRILNFKDDNSPNPPAGTALISPDGSRLLIHTRRGDVQKNLNVESLLLFQTRDVEGFLRSRGDALRPPSFSIPVQREVTGDLGGMRSIQWLNAEQVAFIAEGSNGHTQAFVTNTVTGVTEQITHSATDIASFAISGSTILYYARVKVRLPQVTVVDKPVLQTIFGAQPDWVELAPVELFAMSRIDGDVWKITSPMKVSDYGIWLSPNGDYAIYVGPAVNAPEHWSGYRVPDYEVFGFAPEEATSDATSAKLRLRTRYQLIDLRKRVVRPLLDAPTGMSALNLAPLEVFWPKEGNSAIVSNTFLSLEGADRETLERRRSAPAIAEIDLQSGAATVIAWAPMLTTEQWKQGAPLEYRIAAVNWQKSTNRLTITKARANREVSYEHFAKQYGGWQRTNDDSKPMDTTALAINLRQSLNERPKVYATDAARRSKVLFDPNPEADRFSFGKAEVFRWTDGNAIDWKAGLIFPTNYVPGKRYPAIVQTHGFRPDEFLLDGPRGSTTAFAAQAFANAGFVVLQIEDNAKATAQDEREPLLVSEGYRAGVAALVARGVADPARIGLIAWSRTGYHAIRLLADHPALLAAVSIADSIQPGYLQLLLSVNSREALVQMQKLAGGSPATTGYSKWFEQDPLYRLPGASAAVRLEAISPVSILGFLETYAVLQNAGRPVDFVYFPEGSHSLLKPAERLGSQGGNVDWFRFWLQGHERQEPVVESQETVESLSAQYSRWRKLRELQQEN